jgi:hypothetical protein
MARSNLRSALETFSVHYQVTMIQMTLGDFWEGNCRVRLSPLFVKSLKINEVNQSSNPLLCYAGRAPSA